ncbi:cyclic lactone autoinducer peptide [Clostridium estertheticum]|nr:cyclic lactone autoinducer peptide [Clostridium estertheticum]MBX4267242.1 cyclic lactone autoinducer peptide [Clostridium estertheticum]MBX4272199.1 cyclic lactone autoinducer peptide [Clostridium estertheticum]MCB2357197.1 cyclic lactone autoinducer peptide [Clostridium estertheticum]WAG43952.1 cyclic lactone autoinducer peptide [Clostridium estertheticum]WLC82359.1 cyclic lactone autoinducer peptide [Clostridium estertheticum]
MKTPEKSSIFLKQLAKGLISIGEIHANQLCIGPGFYEPKIPTNLLKSNK